MFGNSLWYFHITLIAFRDRDTLMKLLSSLYVRVHGQLIIINYSAVIMPDAPNEIP